MVDFSPQSIRLIWAGAVLLLAACAEIVPVESSDADSGPAVEVDEEDPIEPDAPDEVASEDLEPLDTPPDADVGSQDLPSDADATLDVDAGTDSTDIADLVEDVSDASDAPDDPIDGDFADASPPDPEVVIGCVSSNDCADPEPICALVELTNGLLATECRDAVGTGAAGAICFFDATCRSNHCLFGANCGSPCSGEADCPRPSDSCRSLPITVDDGGTPDILDDDTVQAVDFCLEDALGSLAPCVANADCPAGEACSLFHDSRLGLERRCRPRNPLGSRNGFCDIDDECQSMACVAGSFCFWPCQGNAECDPDNRCHPTTATGPSSGDEVSVRSCIPTCDSSEDCDSTELCGWFAGVEPQNELVQLCTASTGDLDSGAVCTGDADCKSALCGPNYRCVGPCDPATQSGCAQGTFCYPAMVYVTFDQGTSERHDDVYDAFATCLLDMGTYDPCESDGDCPADETCNVTPNASLTAFERHCVLPVGSGLPGASCFSGDECRSGICLPGGACFGLCDRDGEGSTECAAGATCQTDSFTIDFFGTADNPYDDVTGSLDTCR